MLKKILTIIAVSIAAIYLVLALTCFTGRQEGQVCNDIEISISNNEYDVISDEDIYNILAKSNIQLWDHPIDSIMCYNIEKLIKRESIIEDCECYKTHTQKLGIHVRCKTLVMHIFDKKGNEFYIDRNGNVVKNIPTALYLPVASGYIDESMAKNELMSIANYLHNDKFWMEQIEQFHFTENKEIVLIPRVGNHTIEIGSVKNIESKLSKLKKFYIDGLNKIGWNKYKKLNIEFDNQIICTKNE